MWCHLLLAMPLLGLGLFVFLPWQVALLLYLMVDALSIWLYTRIRQSMKQPVRTGREAMIGQTVTVTAAVGSQDGQVRYHNEVWSAVSDQALPAGEQARIVAMRGMRLVVQLASDNG
jgi:membrane protein implicated in regulation of membrane protease activity